MHGTQGSLHDELDTRALASLRSAGRSRPMRSGELLCWEGQRKPMAYLVERGSVMRTIAIGSCDLAIDSVAAPGLIGAAEITTHTPYTSTACAESDGAVVAIPEAELLRLVDAHEPTRRYVLRVIGDEVRAARRQLAERYGSTTLTRVARHLLDMSADRSDEPLAVHTTQGELAEWVGTTRESTARALGELRERGVITTGRGWIRIDNRERLLELCSV